MTVNPLQGGLIPQSNIPGVGAGNSVADPAAASRKSPRDPAAVVAPLGRQTAQQLILNEILQSLDSLVQAEGFAPLAELDPSEFTFEKVAGRILVHAESFLAKAENQADFDHVLSQVKKGIAAGFENARITLDDLGALKDEGIVSDIEATRTLVDDGLNTLADDILARLIGPDDGSGDGSGAAPDRASV